MVFIYSILLTLKKKKKTAKIAENYFLWVVGISGWKALDRGLQFFVKSLLILFDILNCIYTEVKKLRFKKKACCLVKS